jgi:hypothetical protein
MFIQFQVYLILWDHASLRTPALKVLWVGNYSRGPKPRLWICRRLSVTVVIISVAALRLVAWIVGRIVIIEAEWPYRHNLRDVLAGSGPVEVPGLPG